MTDTALHICQHLLVSLFCTLSTPVLNPSKKFVLIEIEFLTFLIGRK